MIVLETLVLCWIVAAFAYGCGYRRGVSDQAAVIAARIDELRKLR
jgi:hypothetical protein